MRQTTRQLLLGLILILGMALPALAEDYEIPVVTGVQWTKSSLGERKAFLLGAATIIELDQEVQGKTPASNSSIDTWARGLSHFTFDQMVAGLDKWYAAHPDKLDSPVVEVLWHEMAKPSADKK